VVSPSINTPQPTQPRLSGAERTTLAHAKAYLTQPTPTFAPTWEARTGTEADMRAMATRLARGSLHEIEALSRFQTVSFLLKDMDRKLVIVDKANPTKPVSVMDINPGAEGHAAYWSALSDQIIASENYWSLSEYVNGFLNHLNQAYPIITTHVDARNERQIAWLERGGFTRTEELPKHGRNEIKFFVYSRISGDTSDAHGRPVATSLG